MCVYMYDKWFGIRVSGLVSGVSCCGVRVSGFGFRGKG